MSRRLRSGSELYGPAVPPLGLALVSIGTAGGLLFAVAYLIEGVTRPDYDAFARSISALSLGPGGLVQRGNFVAFGLVTLASAWGWRLTLAPGASALAYPVLRGIEGFGLLADGIFSQDPVPGYPPGAELSAPTVHGQIHTLFAFVAITAVALSSFALARRLAKEPRWGRGWAACATVTGILTIVFIALFGVMGANGGLAGLMERLSTGVASALAVLVTGRLLLQARTGARSTESRHG